VARGGYSAALLLDTWALLGRADLRAAEEAFRRWLTAASLVRPSRQGGLVVLVGEASLRPVQALIRWDPAGFADAELADRVAVGLPPARRMAVLRGLAADLADMLKRVALPSGTEVLCPVALPVTEEQQVVLRVRASEGAALSAALATAQGERSVRRGSGHVTIHIDPAHFG